MDIYSSAGKRHVFMGSVGTSKTEIAAGKAENYRPGSYTPKGMSFGNISSLDDNPVTNPLANPSERQV